MILAAYKDPNGNTQGGLYDSYEPYFRETFSPDCEIIRLIEFKVKGKTYAERKAYTEELAKESQRLVSELSLSYGEFAFLDDFFGKVGKRYGLMEEFRENAIC